MAQAKITETFQPKKRIAHANKAKKTLKTTADVEQHPALPCSSFKTEEEEELETLRLFDLNHEYGPCVGISRLERWDRAKRHSLDPPEGVRQLIEAHSGDPRYTNSIWSTYNI